ncbi:hypothetical protein Tco_0944461 [Tanacetum coccineum]
MKHSYSNDDTCLSTDVIDEILEEDFDALLDEDSKILHSIEGTLLEEEIFAEFDEFIAMTADENSDSESDTEDQPFEKITINTDYKIKTSIEEPPTDLELKPLPDNLKYHKQAFAWKTTDIPGICPSFCKHKIQLLDDKKPVVQKQRRLNPNMKEVVKKEIMKLLDTAPYSSFKMIIHHKRILILCISLDHFSCCFAYIAMLPKRWKDICKEAREAIQNDTKDKDPPMDDYLKRTIWGCKRLETNSLNFSKKTLHLNSTMNVEELLNH